MLERASRRQERVQETHLQHIEAQRMLQGELARITETATVLLAAAARRPHPPTPLSLVQPVADHSALPGVLDQREGGSEQKLGAFSSPPSSSPPPSLWPGPLGSVAPEIDGPGQGEGAGG